MKRRYLIEGAVLLLIVINGFNVLLDFEWVVRRWLQNRSGSVR
ncbi:hypothetical protein [Angustibacter luteus]|uniref:Uncharacterized protein n=1 Tax=Angustibacter luteus TaxID=658456 RepID=A0ABW1JJ31_9ACTN